MPSTTEISFLSQNGVPLQPERSQNLPGPQYDNEYPQLQPQQRPNYFMTPTGPLKNGSPEYPVNSQETDFPSQSELPGKPGTGQSHNLLGPQYDNKLSQPQQTPNYFTPPTTGASKNGSPQLHSSEYLGSTERNGFSSSTHIPNLLSGSPSTPGANSHAYPLGNVRGHLPNTGRPNIELSTRPPGAGLLLSQGHNQNVIPYSPQSIGYPTEPSSNRESITYGKPHRGQDFNWPTESYPKQAGASFASYPSLPQRQPTGSSLNEGGYGNKYNPSNAHIWPTAPVSSTTQKNNFGRTNTPLLQGHSGKSLELSSQPPPVPMKYPKGESKVFVQPAILPNQMPAGPTGLHSAHPIPMPASENQPGLLTPISLQNGFNNLRTPSAPIPGQPWQKIQYTVQSPGGIPIGRSVYEYPFNQTRLPRKTITISVPPESQDHEPSLDVTKLNDVNMVMQPTGQIIPVPTFRAIIKRGLYGGTTVAKFYPSGETFIITDGILYVCEAGTISMATGKCEGSLKPLIKDDFEDNCYTDDYPRVHHYACLSTTNYPIYMTYFRNKILCETDAPDALFMTYDRINRLCETVATRVVYKYYTYDKKSIEAGYSCTGENPTVCSWEQNLTLSDSEQYARNY